MSEYTGPVVELPEWHVDVEGCTNFRDAGGWDLEGGGRMRTGRFYRSDDPVRVTDRGRSTVVGMGLQVVVDLRDASRYRVSPGFLPPEQTAHVPLVDRVIDPHNPPTLHDPVDMADLYDGMLARSGPALAQALDTLAEKVTDGPVLVHCAFGKDRAGLVTALVQAAIGVPAESIVADYARSHEPAGRRRAWMLADPQPTDADTTGVTEFLFAAPAEAMSILLDRLIERYGSLDGWVKSLPIRDDTVERLRRALVEE